jgi:glycosyltransferase involved in cell wall biosynthesis
MGELVGELGVSVIVATRNRAARLKQMLGSLKVALDEARGPVDVWLVDNGSTDDTRRVIESWCLRAAGSVAVRAGAGKIAGFECGDRAGKR